MKFTFQRGLFLLMTIISIFLYINVILVYSQCLGDQQSLLLQLKNNLTFDPTSSKNLVHWNQSADCCSWNEVICSEGRVIGLNLSNKSIIGGLDNSSSLFSLQYLQNLSLAFNNFNSAPLPSGFDKLTNLSHLNLSHAGFEGQIPIEISHLTRLVTLDLSTDSFLSISPNLALLVWNLSELVELHLDGLDISTHGNEWCQALLSSVPNLKVLSLSDCYLSGPLDSSLLNLTQLVYLDMSFNNFNGLIPSFSRAKNLTQINLSHNYLTGQITSTHWEELQHLVILELSGNLLEGSIPVSLFSLPSLQVLLLSNNQISGQLNEFNSSSSLFDTLDLSGNLLKGSIPVSLFSLPSLQELRLSKNRFSGQFNEFNSSSSLLDILDLSSNSLEGPIPMSVFDLRGLKWLSLSSNKFHGSFPLHMIQQLENLLDLDLSHNNNLLIEYHGTNSSLPLILKLASVNLKTFPDFLRNQSKLGLLDLSENEIQGEIPNWIWKLQSLQYLNLSNNNLVTLEGHILDLPSQMLALDLHSNQLQGQIPILPSVAYLDLSRNNFSSYIPASIGDKLNFTFFLSLSSNDLRGSIPESICSASNLENLDLSDNFLSGEIPPCLTEMNLKVLNLSTNNLSGTISDTFPINHGLRTLWGYGLQVLDLSENILEGVVPKSLANCTSLRVLNLGKNQIKDKFPCHLKNMSSLRVLGLRENKFYGSINCPGQNGTWPRLQIVDLARNSFNGTLSIKFFKTWEAMMADEDKMLQYELELVEVFHHDAITLISKGRNMVFTNTPLTLLTMIDVSYNNLQGPIPEEIGALNALVGLNLSHNAFTGRIPPSLGNLTELESLDLSRNNLNGEIPTELANLNFLSVMDLSFNHLKGKIPVGTQLQSFPASSFEGNTGLCGAPLTKECRDVTVTPSPPTIFVESTHSNHGVSIAWKYISAELGFVFGFGIVIFPLMFWKRWRIWYYNRVDDILFRIFPELYLGKEYRGRGRRVFTNWRLRH